MRGQGFHFEYVDGGIAYGDRCFNNRWFCVFYALQALVDGQCQVLQWDGQLGRFPHTVWRPPLNNKLRVMDSGYSPDTQCLYGLWGLFRDD